MRLWKRPTCASRLLAILARDAVGYSRLMALEEHSGMAAARAVSRERVYERGGRVIDG